MSKYRTDNCQRATMREKCPWRVTTAPINKCTILIEKNVLTPIRSRHIWLFNHYSRLCSFPTSNSVNVLYWINSVLFKLEDSFRPYNGSGIFSHLIRVNFGQKIKQSIYYWKTKYFWRLASASRLRFSEWSIESTSVLTGHSRVFEFWLPLYYKTSF